MTILVNSISTKGPEEIDKRIKEKVILLANAPISDHVAEYIGQTLWAVAEQLEKDNMLDKITTVSCIFTKDGKFSIELDPNSLGVIMRLIVFPMDRWLKSKNQLSIYIIMMEEFAHHFWNIEDEVEVNYKVLEIINHLFPKIEMGDIYDLDFMENPTY